LRLGITGAILAAAGQQLAPLAPETGGLNTYLLRAPGFLGSIVIAVAAYCSAQALAGNRDRAWIRARAAAESIKSAIFLYRASAPPFDTPARTKELQTRIEKTLQDLTDVEKRQPAADDKKPELTPLTVEGYIKARPKDQID
jgi:SMODS and SLOG-associating 2TM effector domain 3